MEPVSPPIPPVEMVQEPVEQPSPQVVMVQAPPLQISNEQNVKMVPNAYTEETINEESMRDALAELVKSKIFWGKKAVKQMSISNIQTWSTYYCTWETFMESRSTKSKTRPFKGGLVDGPQNGYPPQPWEIPINYPGLFEETEVKVPVPHTEAVQQCHKCLGRGRVKCKNCDGRGRNQCYSCGGSGTRRVEDRNVECHHCQGRGRIQCDKCRGDGMTKCKECDGSGQVVSYIQLKVTFVNHFDEEFVDHSGLPNDVIRKSISTSVCNQMGFHILPPQDVFQPEVREACSRLFVRAEQLVNGNQERLLQQRVCVNVIPVAKAVGTWKNKTCEFWVHGNNKVAYAPRYLKEFYHGCSIMYGCLSEETKEI